MTDTFVVVLWCFFSTSDFWGEVMLVGGLRTTRLLLYLWLRAQHDITPPHNIPQPCRCHGSGVAGPARPACSLPGEGATCQRRSSHPSTFLIFFLPVCTSEQVYLPGVTFHQLQDVASIAYSFLSSLLRLPGLTHHHHHLSPARWDTVPSLCYLPSPFSASPLHNRPFTGFCQSLRSLSIQVFPFPRFLPVPHLGAEPVEQQRRTGPRPNLPPSLSLPMYACLRLGLRLRPAPIALPHQHIYCTCLLAPCHAHTQFPFIYREKLAEGGWRGEITHV